MGSTPRRTDRRTSADYSACRLFSRWFLAQLVFSTLKMEAICSSETSVDTQWTTRRYTPEIGTLHTEYIVYIYIYIYVFI
jgi:hypothetical protein